MPFNSTFFKFCLYLFLRIGILFVIAALAMHLFHFLSHLDVQELKMQKIPYDGESRVESGAIQFVSAVGEDWPGLFLRGDNAMGIAMEIGQLEAYFKHVHPLTGEYSFMMNRLSSLKETILKDVVGK